MNMAWLLCMMLMLVFQLSQATDADPENNLSSVTKRSTTPTELRNSNNEGDSVYNPVDSSTVKPQRIISLSGTSCKEIKERLHHEYGASLENGVYEVQGKEIYCDMKSIDGGGWTLVWQHTYMKFNPLNSDMFYFSDHYRSCHNDPSYEDWCNIPDKLRFDPTEMMIAAYHSGTIVYAYKGDFNHYIDYHWSGALLNNPTKLIDECANPNSNGGEPAPPLNEYGILGLTFYKRAVNELYYECDNYDIESTLTNPIDCRWYACRLPSDISTQEAETSMTMAIFVR